MLCGCVAARGTVRLSRFVRTGLDGSDAVGRDFARYGFALVFALVFGVVSVSTAFVPRAERTLKAIAEVNKVSGRAKAIQLDLTMRIGDREPIASGELISHPTGLARLELRGYGGRVDRYLLSGSELQATKDGQRLDRPQPMLQPFFLLQPITEETLRAALQTFGVQSQWIGLAPCGEQDCFVIGDPRLDATPPAPPLAAEMGDGEVLDDPLEELDDDDPMQGEDGDLGEHPLSGPSLELAEDGRIPRLWVDTRELQVRRIDRQSGVFVIFGPMKRFEKLTVPAWFEIHEPGAKPIRFEVEAAVQVNAAAKAFSRKWLFAPMHPESEAGDGSDSQPGAPAPSGSPSY